jgi:sulfhydrogenase subunit delta
VINGTPRIAFFDFAGCEGCQLTVLGMGESLLDILHHVKVVSWREAMSENDEGFDIAVVEGSITRDSDMDRLKRIREQADCLIALGACATLGGVQVLGNELSRLEKMRRVYGDESNGFEAGKVRAISDVVPVDYFVHGCPIDPKEFVAVLKHVLLGRPYRIPDQPVCVECKLRENECVLQQGKMCLGPVTRGGCDAICPSVGERCFGCRGLIDDPNLQGARLILEEHGCTIQQIVDMFNIYSLGASPGDKMSAA